ncbi:predicted protein [Botrytis cinerea T4]|uniref:Uncharacterized protein n=1 Tax=Botryotinia fuckeliana (strain T4) TaxID=999810 RepID=G2XZ98_BOTF4|nr:predicted protein [Botrytis cinerea T4]
MERKGGFFYSLSAYLFVPDTEPKGIGYTFMPSVARKREFLRTWKDISGINLRTVGTWACIRIQPNGAERIMKNLVLDY